MFDCFVVSSPNHVSQGKFVHTFRSTHAHAFLSMVHSRVDLSSLLLSSKVVLTRARYDNVAETKDELSFNQGDIISILQKSTGMENWWLCQTADRVGLVPANYLEEIPAVPEISESSLDQEEDHIYDQIPAQMTPEEQMKRFSQPENPSSVMYPESSMVHLSASMQNIRLTEKSNGLYDVPRALVVPSGGTALMELSRSRSLTPASSFGRDDNLYDQLPQRARAISDVQQPLYDSPRSTRALYQVPSGIYDVPKSNKPIRTFDDGYFSPKRESVLPLSIEMMSIDDACRKLQQLNEEINRTWEELVESVYNARWDGTFKDLTVARTIAATQGFDAQLNSFLEFIKGVINVLSQSKEENPRLKFTNQFTKLHESRVDFLEKLGYIQDGTGDVQGAAQGLISHGLNMLQNIRELDILVRAFRSIIFKQSTDPNGRPGDYASASLDVRQMRRKPTDALPPTPTSQMTDTEIVQNLQKVKNFSKSIASNTPSQSPEVPRLDNKAKHLSARSWGSQESILSSSVPVGVHYVSPPIGRNLYDPYTSRRSSGSTSPLSVSDEETAKLQESDRQCVEMYTREFVSSLPHLIKGVQKLRACIEETKQQAIHRAQNGHDETAKENLIGCSGEIIKVGHSIVIQGDCVFKKIENVPAKVAVTTASNSVSMALRTLGEDSKAAVLQYPNLAAIDKVAVGVENVRVSTISLGKLLKELAAKN